MYCNILSILVQKFAHLQIVAHLPIVIYNSSACVTISSSKKDSSPTISPCLLYIKLQRQAYPQQQLDPRTE